MYFGLLALGRLALLLVVAFATSLAVSDPHQLPPNTFTQCGLVQDFRFQAVPGYIGTAFGMCFCTVHTGHYRSREAPP